MPRVNSLISYVNTIIYTRVLSEIYKTQLNPTISYLHEPSERRSSLCLDIAEIFKPIIGDRLIFSMLNKKQITENDFEKGLNFLYLKENARKEIEGNKKEQEQIEIQINANQYTLTELRKDKRFNVQEQIIQAKQELEEENKKQAEEEKKIEEKEKEETKQLHLQKEAKQQKDSSMQEFKKQEEQAGNKAKDIQYDEYFFRMDEIKENLEKEYNYDSLNQDMKYYVQKIEQGRNALQEAKKVEIEYDEVLQELDKKRKEESEKSQEITKDRIALEEEKQNFLEEIYGWEEKNGLLKMQYRQCGNA